MEVLLKKNMDNLGEKDEIVTVKNGYGRNYLIPKGIAIVATDSVKKMKAETLRQRAHKEEKIRTEAEKLAKKLEKAKIVVGAKVGIKGKIFGSVSSKICSARISFRGPFYLRGSTAKQARRAHAIRLDAPTLANKPL